MNITVLFIVGSIALFLASWLAFDLAVALWFRPKYGTPTITHEVRRLGRRYLAATFLAGLVIGLVCGHLFGDF
jgi:hypothetical protein